MFKSAKSRVEGDPSPFGGISAMILIEIGKEFKKICHRDKIRLLWDLMRDNYI